MSKTLDVAGMTAEINALARRFYVSSAFHSPKARWLDALNSAQDVYAGVIASTIVTDMNDPILPSQRVMELFVIARNYSNRAHSVS